jgi:hypothetical protein
MVVAPSQQSQESILECKTKICSKNENNIQCTLRSNAGNPAILLLAFSCAFSTSVKVSASTACGITQTTTTFREVGDGRENEVGVGRELGLVERMSGCERGAELQRNVQTYGSEVRRKNKID